MKRIVITGMGAITPIGNDPDSFWNNLLIGKSGAGALTRFDAGDMPYNIACEVKEFDARKYMDRKFIQRTARSTQFAVAATKQALTGACLEISDANRDEVGVMMATGGGGAIAIEHAAAKLVEKSWKTVGPFVVPSAMANAASCVVSMAVGARGPVMTSVAACASGHYSILEAYHFLQRGEADVMIAGGTESAISMLMCAAFGNMGPLSRDTDRPQQACRPFSIDRNGFVSGEGAVSMIMETEEHARARGAEIYAEVLGGALTADAYHLAAPDPSARGARRAMQKALSFSSLAPEDVDLILAHGTGTELNDEVEAPAIRQVFGRPAPKTTSIKSMVGHALGAAGAESALAAVMAIRENIIPPTINYTEAPDLGVEVVGNKPLEHKVRYAIVNGFGFGGQNVVAAFGEYDG